MLTNFQNFRISETMMKTEEIKENIKKEKDSTEKSAAKLMAAYDIFKKNANEDYEKIKNAFDEMKTVKPKF